MNLLINDQPAVRITAFKIKETENAVLMNCEGDLVWFGKKYVQVEEAKKTMLIQQWLYDLKVKNGEL